MLRRVLSPFPLPSRLELVAAHLAHLLGLLARQTVAGKIRTENSLHKCNHLSHSNIAFYSHLARFMRRFIAAVSGKLASFFALRLTSVTIQEQLAI